MRHLEVENLASDYLEGQLAPGRRAEVEAHLADCAGCRELLADVSRAIELCRSTEELEPAPWLASKILLATVGQRKLTLRDRFAALLRPGLQPRVAYVVAMAVFSFSIIVNAAGLDPRNLTLQDLNPRAWAYRANRQGHLLYARAEKFYYDLRVVYEIESRFRRLRVEPGGEEKQAPKPEAPPGGSTGREPLGRPQLASLHGPLASGSDMVGTERSPSR